MTPLHLLNGQRDFSMQLIVDSSVWLADAVKKYVQESHLEAQQKLQDQQSEIERYALQLCKLLSPAFEFLLHIMAGIRQLGFGDAHILRALCKVLIIC